MRLSKIFSLRGKLLKRLIRVLNLQQNLQQFGAFGLLLRYCCDSVIIISLYLTIINVFSTISYKPDNRISNPAVPGSNPGGRGRKHIKDRGCQQ